jgi:hypothetical protein
VRRVLAAVAAASLIAGCSSGSEPAEEQTPAPGSQAADGTGHRSGDPAPRRPPLRRAHCPRRLTNCQAASGRIIYVERVDPDGDGDAHFVLLSPQGITAPGITVVDVKRSLRPSPLPGPGQRLSAAGPVYRGSYGQRQIEAIEVHGAAR